MTASCIPVHALTPVRDYKGPCTLVLSKRSIGVSTDNENLGTWPFECIRRFHSQDLNYFSFTSGRRGPYGVCDYTFKIKDEDLKKLQDILSQCTGAKFDSPRGFRSGSGSSSLIDSTPRHTTLKSRSYSHVSTPPNTTQPGYTTMTIPPNTTQPSYTTMTIPRNLSEDVNSRSLSQKIPPLSPLTSPVPFLSPHPNKEKAKDYDRLENAKQDTATFLDGISPIKQDPINQEDTCDMHQHSTKQEVRQIKQFNKEPLVNKSPIVLHAHRDAQYVDIDLPNSESEDTGSQPTFNQYDHPISLVEQPIYDVPPPAIPLVQNTYDIPSSIQRQSIENVYGVPRSTKSPLQRALPHLPTDYENISPPGQKIIGNRAYVNVGRGETGLYMEVPLAKFQSKSMINIYHDIPEIMESQLSIRRVESDQTTTAGERLAKELAEEGYEFVKPALLPALISPPPVSIKPVLEEPDEEQETDEYIEVRRSKSPPTDNDFLKVTSTMPGRSRRGKDGYEVVDDKLRKTTNISIDKQHVNIPKCRRWSDGYEDINELMREIQPETTSQDSGNSHQDGVNNSEVMNETPLMKELPNDISDDDVYIAMHSADLQPDKSSPLSIPKRTYIPTALGSPDAAHAMLLRKRSLTIGDPLDSKEAKKHTYVNVPDESSVPQRSFTGESMKKKPPMPLPRSTSSKDVIINSGANENHSNNKVQILVRQFSDC